jgi:hypothetical protein
MFHCTTLKQIFCRLELQPRIVKTDVALTTLKQQYLATFLAHPHHLPSMLCAIVDTVQSKSVNYTVKLPILKHVQVSAIPLQQFYFGHALCLFKFIKLSETLQQHRLRPVNPDNLL